MTERATAVRPFASSFVEYARSRPEVVCLTNDLTASCEADEFRDALPERFYALGMAEQNLIGIAAGMARAGAVPFYPTFGVFATRRPYEQIVLQVAYPGLPVRILGFLPGITTPGGVTHQATDDVALMRLLPGMTVIDVGDATEVETVWRAFDEVPGPIYCRMLRGEVPRLFTSPFEFGRTRILAEGSDVLLVSAGITTQVVIDVVADLHEQGLDVGHAHVSTLKPFGDELLASSIQRARLGVVTIENHLSSGGVGTAIAEMIAEGGLDARLVRLGVADRYTRGGSREYLMQHYGFGARGIANAVRQLAGMPNVDVEEDTSAEGPPSLRTEVAEGL